jgi:hypothetical protein
MKTSGSLHKKKKQQKKTKHPTMQHYTETTHLPPYRTPLLRLFLQHRVIFCQFLDEGLKIILQSYQQTGELYAMESQNALRFRPKTVEKFPAGPPLHKVLPFAGCSKVLDKFFFFFCFFFFFRFRFGQVGVKEVL